VVGEVALPAFRASGHNFGVRVLLNCGGEEQFLGMLGEPLPGKIGQKVLRVHLLAVRVEVAVPVAGGEGRGALAISGVG
jgi:hypothetical protein